MEPEAKALAIASGTSLEALPFIKGLRGTALPLMVFPEFPTAAGLQVGLGKSLAAVGPVRLGWNLAAAAVRWVPAMVQAAVLVTAPTMVLGMARTTVLVRQVLMHLALFSAALLRRQEGRDHRAPLPASESTHMSDSGRKVPPATGVDRSS
jgi:hypothetical protein